MQLSILDQSPILEKASAEQALHESNKLAQLGECFGYKRYWLTEHHNFKELASSTPEVLLAYIGANTEKIRIGAGAILLPHYKPYKIAETFHTLACLFPGRIDLGLGRAPGGSAEATMALSDQYLQKVYQFPDAVKELLQFLQSNFASDHIFSKVSPVPLPKISPEVWLLGTSAKSAKLAANYGLAYAFGQFMSENDGVAIFDEYKEGFQPQYLNHPKMLVTVNVICAETTEKAKQIYIESQNRFKASGVEKQEMDEREFNQEKIIIGNPKEVKAKLEELANRNRIEEIMINTVATTYKNRTESFKLLAEHILS